MAIGWGPGHIWLHTTLEGPWPHYMILEVSWDGLWTLSFGLSKFHGHGSWLVCEVALSPPRALDKPSQTSRCPWHESPNHDILVKNVTQNIYWRDIKWIFLSPRGSYIHTPNLFIFIGRPKSLSRQQLPCSQNLLTVMLDVLNSDWVPTSISSLCSIYRNKNFVFFVLLVIGSSHLTKH